MKRRRRRSNISNMVERVSEHPLGRAVSFLINGQLNVEELASNLAGQLNCELDLSRNIKGVVFGFKANPPHFTIHGRWINMNEKFEIKAGVNHNLYDSYKIEFEGLLGSIRDIVRNT